jgi:RNA polymerase sigma-70 factor (ECF subfamily)
MEPGPDRYLQQARTGDPEAFTALVRECDAGMRALVFSLVRDRWLMDDVLQQAYEKAFRRISSFRGESSFSTWLHRICWTTAVDMLRAEGRRAHLPMDDASLGGLADPDPATGAIARLTWQQAWNRLPDDQCAALALVIGEGLNYQDAATVCGTTPGTIASRVSRGRARLKALLSDHHPTAPDRVVPLFGATGQPSAPPTTPLTSRPDTPGDGPNTMESLA